jgi:hypothetical protein
MLGAGDIVSDARKIVAAGDEIDALRERVNKLETAQVRVIGELLDHGYHHAANIVTLAFDQEKP